MVYCPYPNQHALCEMSQVPINVGEDGTIRSEWRMLLRGIIISTERMHMPKSKMEAFEVGCPCCGALLKVDPDTRAVIAHTPPVRPKTFNDFEEAARAMREQEGRKESLFRQAVDAEKNKADLLERKFQEAVKRAKDTPDTGKPLRDFDLD